MKRLIIMGKPVHKIYMIPSSKEGQPPYETIHFCDGSTSCNCFGWIKGKARGADRTCRHVRLIEMGCPELYAVNSKEFEPLDNEPVSTVVRSVPIPVSRPAIPVSGKPVMLRKFNWDEAA